MPEYSVIMTCWGKLDEVTSSCLPSFYQTESDWEFIIVDNASPDDTATWLAEQAEEQPFMKPILLDENRGYAGGLNAGLEVATGDYIVLMNNDIICNHPLWLESVFNPVKGNSMILTGPRLIYDNTMTDVGGGPIPYLEGWLLAATSKFWRDMRGMDPRYGLAWFEDVDISWRAREAGYALHENIDVPVMHMFGRTAYQSGLDFHAITQKNKALFTDIYYGDKQPWHLVERTLISGLMRTLNEEDNLKISLPNWMKFCDEIVISDGGSTDNTRAVAEEIAGDKLVWLDFDGGSISDKHFQNHAGQQLNYGLDHCSGEWVVTQDADTIYCERFVHEIKSVLSSAKYPAYITFGAHVLEDWTSYIDQMMEGPGVVQIFRNNLGHRFPDKPEEAHLINSFDDDKVGILDYGVYHWGYMDKESYIDKLQRRAEVFRDDNDSYESLASVFARALSHITANGWGDVFPIPWDRCHVDCKSCWMRDRALERREGETW